MAQHVKLKENGKAKPKAKRGKLRVVVGSSKSPSAYAVQTLGVMRVAVRKALKSHAAKRRKVTVIKNGVVVVLVPDRHGKIPDKVTAAKP